MFTKTISSFSLAAAALGMAALSTPAAACTDTSGQWDCIHDGGSSVSSVSGARYRGGTTISHWYSGTVWCDSAEVPIDLAINGGALDIGVDWLDFSSSLDPSCANFVFSNLTWTGSFGGAGSPASETDTAIVATTISTPVVKYNGVTICQGSLGTTLNNDGTGGSYIVLGPTMSGWAGTCTFDSTLYNGSISAH